MASMTISRAIADNPWLFLIGSLCVAGAVLLFVYAAVLAAVGGGL